MLFMVQYGHKIANKIRPEKGNLRAARALTLFAPSRKPTLHDIEVENSLKG
jgi:hypothetical protein